MTAISYRNARCVSAQRCLRRDRCWRGRRCSSCSLQNGTSFLFSRTAAELWLCRRAPCSSLLTFTHTIREKNKLKTHKNQGSTAGCGHFRLARTAKCGNTEEKMEFCSGLQRDNWILCRSFVQRCSWITHYDHDRSYYELIGSMARRYLVVLFRNQAG